MLRLPARQIHLDFHTAESIDRVGAKFERKKFQAALRQAHVNSVTVFAKCHHSWSYYPTKVGRRHPSLKIDLLGQQIDACHAMKIRAPIYYTVGWSAADVADHPDWAVRNRDGSIATIRHDVAAAPSDPKPPTSWVFLCPSGAYRDLIVRQTEEICRRYPVDGFFYDICDVSTACWCDRCRAGMEEEQLDLTNDADARIYHIQQWVRLMTDCNHVIHNNHRDATIFYNGTTKLHSPHEYAAFNTHFELEDLPTTWGGYDKLPLRAKLFSEMGKPTLAMSGKFHTQWGEFGGFKHPHAIRYECAMMIAYGAACSMGDQLHPSGQIDPATYRNIGHAYEYVKRIEDYGLVGKPLANLGIYVSGQAAHDEGVARMLLERQIDFEAVRRETDLARYDAIILTGATFLDDAQAESLREFVADGGSLLILGQSLFDRTGKMLFDIGGKFIGPSRYDCDYTLAGRELSEGLVDSPFLNYTPAPRIVATSGHSLAAIHEPLFSRTYWRYCSHMNAPHQLTEADHSAVIQKGRIIYCAHALGKMYADDGARLHRDLFINALRRVYRKQILTTTLPSAGRASLLHQPDKKRYVVHLLYSPPLQRGRTLVIEDFPTIYDVPVELRVPEKIKRVRLPLNGKTLKVAKGRASHGLTVPELKDGHQVVVFEY
ncbi:MAG TPA: alpha-amylase family protein [Humisphaera sp.]|jgi:hypothetical protein|nr:alpha-amylase family protein [Humisphaera sp.]